MKLSEVQHYIAAYNAHDYPTVASYYTDDVVLESFGAQYVGPQVLQFLEQIHQGVHDRMVPLSTTINDDCVVLQVDLLMEALRDLPDLPAGAMKAGERRTMPLTITYQTRGAKFYRISIEARRELMSA